MKGFIQGALLMAALGICVCCAPAQETIPLPDTPASPPPAVFTASNSPSPSPSPDPLTAPEGSYTFAWISDTQHYSRSFPDIFWEMTSFLSAQRQRLQLKYVIHTGDLVQDFDDPEQWRAAQWAMSALGDLPWGVLAGNHDVNFANADYSMFLQFFGEERFIDNGVYAQGYLGSRGHLDLVDAGNARYVFAYMGYPVDQDGAAWLCQAFSAYPERIGVLCVHDYLNTDLSYSQQGELLLRDVVLASPNVYLVLCGHRYNCACVPLQAGDRRVLQLICNYQAAGEEGGSGYIRFLRFDEEKGLLHLISFSPLLRDYVFYDSPENASDPYAFAPEGEWETVPIPWLG